MVAAVVLACGVWTLVRTDGITGGGMAELTWRWNKTAEEKLLAESSRELPVKPEVTPAPAPAMSAAAPAPSSPAAPAAPTPQPVEAATAPKAAESVTAAAPAPRRQDASRVARLSRPETRRHRSRRADRD